MTIKIDGNNLTIDKVVKVAQNCVEDQTPNSLKLQ